MLSWLPGQAGAGQFCRHDKGSEVHLQALPLVKGKAFRQIQFRRYHQGLADTHVVHQDAVFLAFPEETDVDGLPRVGGKVVAELLVGGAQFLHCLLYTSDAADDLLCVDLGGRRIIKKKTNIHTYTTP